MTTVPGRPGSGGRPVQEAARFG